jgi:hypothetical protein
VTLSPGLRVEFAGAVYQVMARGNERRDSLRDDRDRKRFLVEMLGEMAERLGARVSAYCLIPNHYSPVRPQDRHAPLPLGWKEELDRYE